MIMNVSFRSMSGLVVTLVAVVSVGLGDEDETGAAATTARPAETYADRMLRLEALRETIPSPVLVQERTWYAAEIEREHRAIIDLETSEAEVDIFVGGTGADDETFEAISSRSAAPSQRSWRILRETDGSMTGYMLDSGSGRWTQKALGDPTSALQFIDEAALWFSAEPKVKAHRAYLESVASNPTDYDKLTREMAKQRIEGLVSPTSREITIGAFTFTNRTGRVFRTGPLTQELTIGLAGQGLMTFLLEYREDGSLLRRVHNRFLEKYHFQPPPAYRIGDIYPFPQSMPVGMPTKLIGTPMYGIRYARIDGEWRIESVFPGSSAEAAGIAKGDILLEINGENLSGAPAGTVARLLEEASILVRWRRGKAEQTAHLDKSTHRLWRSPQHPPPFH